MVVPAIVTATAAGGWSCVCGTMHHRCQQVAVVTRRRRITATSNSSKPGRSQHRARSIMYRSTIAAGRLVAVSNIDDSQRSRSQLSMAATGPVTVRLYP